eukprot:1180642-Prorocentrum_minimum.AAC.1
MGAFSRCVDRVRGFTRTVSGRVRRRYGRADLIGGALLHVTHQLRLPLLADCKHLAAHRPIRRLQSYGRKGPSGRGRRERGADTK